nr:hypothetical protein [Nonlabens ulvanivorans]
MKKMFFIILLLCSAMGWSQDAFAKAESLFNSEQYEAAKPYINLYCKTTKKTPP